MRCIADFLAGLLAHGRGIAYAFANPSYLPLLLIPFLLTLGLFALGLYMLFNHAEPMLHYFWSVDPTTAGTATSVMYWIYTHIVKYLLYLFLIVVQYFLFMVVANILASPLYDYIADKLRRRGPYAADLAAVLPREIGILALMREELKKAVFTLGLPLALLLIPIIGPFIGLPVAMIMLAWDYTDFSLVRDRPTLRERLRYIRQHLFLMLGFGSLLLVPFLNFLLFPFAVLSAALLYHQRLAEERARGGGQA